MANIKKNVNSNEKIEEKNIVKEDNSKVVKALREENKNKDEKINKLEQDVEILKEQLSILIQNATMQRDNVSKDDELIDVGCRSIFGESLSRENGKYFVNFLCDEIKSIDKEDLSLYLKESFGNRRLFENGTFFFVDKKYYDDFRLKQVADLSKENIISILTEANTNTMIDRLNELTNNLTNQSIVRLFQFEVVKLLIDPNSELNKGWNYDNRHILEKYIGQKFDDLLASVGAVQLLGHKIYSE